MGFRPDFQPGNDHHVDDEGTVKTRLVRQTDRQTASVRMLGLQEHRMLPQTSWMKKKSSAGHNDELGGLKKCDHYTLKMAARAHAAAPLCPNSDSDIRETTDKTSTAKSDQQNERRVCFRQARQ